jgi:hypothetical protein
MIMVKMLIGAVVTFGLAMAAAPVFPEEQYPEQNVEAKGGVHLSHDRAVKIAHALMATANPQDVSLDVTVGSNLPGNAEIRALPSAVAKLAPEYQGYEYAVTRDKIVIVQPSTRRVVEILSRGE